MSHIEQVQEVAAANGWNMRGDGISAYTLARGPHRVWVAFNSRDNIGVIHTDGERITRNKLPVLLAYLRQTQTRTESDIQ